MKQPDLPADVLLLTVKDCEFLSCYNELKDPYRYYYKDVGFVYFNNVQSHEEKVKVALLRCNKGSIGPSSCQECRPSFTTQGRNICWGMLWSQFWQN